MSGIIGSQFNNRGSGLIKSQLQTGSIANDVLDSDHYVDGSIDTAHLSDDAVSLAKMASGTDGQIITYDASGNPTAVGPGTDGQVLTSTGAGSPPAFEDAGGGAWNLVSTTNVTSSVSTVEVTGIDNSSQLWVWVLSGIHGSANAPLYPEIRTSNDTSSHSYDSGASDYMWQQGGANVSTAYAAQDNADDSIRLFQDPTYIGFNANQETLGAEFYVYDPAETSYYSMISWRASGQQNDPTVKVAYGAGVRLATEAVTALQFFFSSGTVDDGRFSLYKLTTS